MSRKGERTNSKSALKINCITDGQSDTLLYACDQPQGGWILYSSDMRVPAIVAQGDQGSFEDLMKIEGARLWVEGMAQDIRNIKKLENRALNFTKTEIADNRAFWESVRFPDKFLIDKQEDANFIKIDTAILKPLNPIPNGHYEYVCSDSYYEVFDSIPRIITTHWHQGHPLNKYCPRRSDFYTNAPAGCVAIAAAQILFHMHNKHGIPRTAPSEAYCNSTVGDPVYDWAQTNYTTTIWNKMANDETFAAPLVADIGRRVNMRYGNTSSGACAEDLVKKVFEPYGVKATYSSYNADKLKSSLQKGVPVILRAVSYVEGTSNKEGHCFIADRYRRTREVVRHIYRWKYDYMPENTFIPFVMDSISYSYQSPVIDMISMNWGWNYYYDMNAGWHALTGDWYTHKDNENMHWNLDRDMICFDAVNLQKPRK